MLHKNTLLHKRSVPVWQDTVVILVHRQTVLKHTKQTYSCKSIVMKDTALNQSAPAGS